MLPPMPDTGPEPAAPPQTPCPDHPGFPAAGTCERCGRFFCVRCFPDIVTQARGRCLPCQEREAREATGHKSIGGWLVLVALGLVLTPIQLVAGISQDVTTLQKDNLVEGARPIIAVELLATVGMLGVTLWAANSFFRRKRDAPRMMIILYALALASGVLEIALRQAILGLSEGRTSADAETLLDLVAPLIRAAIWIPYFLSSKRVKETFVVD